MTIFNFLLIFLVLIGFLAWTWSVFAKNKRLELSNNLLKTVVKVKEKQNAILMKRKIK